MAFYGFTTVGASKTIMAFINIQNRRIWLAALYLVDAFVVGVALGIFYSRPAYCSDVPCNRLKVRVWVIENIIRQAAGSPRYLLIGDSITEAAVLPDICGRKPINAGIVGATVRTFDALALRLADLAQPDFIVLALGTNDALHGETKFKERISLLVSSLKSWPIIVIPIPPGQAVRDAVRFNEAIEALPLTKAKVISGIKTTDGVHLTTASYITWKKSIVSAASELICPH